MYLLKILDIGEPETYETTILVSDSKDKIFKFLLTLPFMESANEKEIKINYKYFHDNEVFRTNINEEIQLFSIFNNSILVIEPIASL